MASHIRRYAAALLSTSILFAAGPALAQSPAQSDQDETLPVYLEADSLQDLGNGEGYLARGNVRARHEGRTLFADELEYRPANNRVIARGNVIIFGEGDFPQYADEVELDSELSTGVVLGFATMLENNGRVAAATAIRRANGTLELGDAYYTACELCEDGEGSPTWRIRANEVIQDAEDEMIYYRGAKFEVMGVPVLYAPVFAHADPSAERQSGFLFPKLNASSRLGFVYGQPYYWAISPHQDLTIAPRYMSNVNPLLELEYRKRFWSGSLQIEGSFTREMEVDGDGELFGEEKDRWHVFGGGAWAITPNWRWGFGVQRASDDLHIRRYDFNELDRDRGNPLQSLNRDLVSQVFVEGRTSNMFASAITASYQSLREGVDDDALPVLAPLLSVHRIFALPDHWGRIGVEGDLAFLNRENGADYRRGSLSLDWRARHVTSGGLVVSPFAYGRVDSYDISDIPMTGTQTRSDSFSRSLGLAGAEVSLPLYRAGREVDWILEPVVSAVTATDDPEGSRVLNQDSLALDLDESLLFDPVRAPGYDIWEPGQRVNYGVRATAQWSEDGFARLFAGQSHRIDGVAVFNPSSGLFEENSDYIVAGEIDIAGFTANVETRLDSDDFDIDRLGASLGYSSSRFYANVRYLDVSDDDSTASDQRELRVRGRLQLTDHWSLITLLTQDLDQDLTRQFEAGFRFRDDCTQMDIVYKEQDLGINDLGPSESIQVRFTLVSLGSLIEE